MLAVLSLGYASVISTGRMPESLGLWCKILTKQYTRLSSNIRPNPTAFTFTCDTKPKYMKLYVFQKSHEEQDEESSSQLSCHSGADSGRGSNEDPDLTTSHNASVPSGNDLITVFWHL